MNDLLKKRKSEYKYGYFWASNFVNAWVVSDTPEVLDVCRNYLRPTASWSEQEVKIHLVNSEPLFTFFAEAESPSSKISVKSDILFSKWHRDGFEVFANISNSNSNCLIVRRDNSYWIISNQKFREEELRVPVRIIREYILRQAQNYGGLFTHAAAVGNHKCSYLIPGHSGSGKTTLMWTLCRLLNFDYISNDRCILKSNDEKLPNIYGWPLSIRLGRGLVIDRRSKVSLPELLRFENQEVQHMTSMPVWGEKSKFELTPMEFEKVSEVQVNEKGRLGAILIPNLTIGGPEIEIREEHSAGLESVMLDSITEPLDSDYLNGWLGLRKINDSDVNLEVKKMVERLKEIPCYRVSGNVQKLLENPSIIQSLLDGL